MAMVQIQSYNFSTIEATLSDGGNFTSVNDAIWSGILKVITGNKCEPTNTATASASFWSGAAVQTGDSWPADQYAEVTLTTFSNIAQDVFYFFLRQGTAVSGNAYVGLVTNGSYAIYANVGASLHLIQTALTTPAQGDVWRFTVVGNVLTLTQNGTQRASVADTNNYVTSGSPGLGLNSGSAAITTVQTSLWAAGANQAATPTFSPVAGSYSGTQTVTITSSTPTGTIFYTTDGSTPTHSSSSIANGGNISVSASHTVKAFVSVSNFADSAAGSAAYTITIAVSNVAVNGNTNVSAGTSFSVVVTVNAPVTQDTVVSLATVSGESITGTVTGTITTGTSTVTISSLALFTAATGTVISATRVSGDTVTSGNSAAFNVIPNTINRANTTALSAPRVNTAFSVQIVSTDGFGNVGPVTQDTAMVLAVGNGTGSIASGSTTGTITSGQSTVTITGVKYSKIENSVQLTATSTSGDSVGPLGTDTAFDVTGTATPTFSPVAGTYTTIQHVTINDTDSGLSGFAIYYTLDGSTPDHTSTLYTGPVSIGSTLTLKAIATATSGGDSAVGSAAYTINIPAPSNPTGGLRVSYYGGCTE